MIVATLLLAIRIAGAETLKDKRKVVKSLLEKTRNRFHVAIAEVEDLDQIRCAIIGIATVSNNERHAESTLDHVLRALDSNPEITVEILQRDVLRS